MDEDQAYRAMGLLVEADAQVELQEAVFFAVVNLLNVEVDLLFFDTAHTVAPRAQVPSTSAAECLEGLDRAACCPAALDPGVAGDQRNAEALGEGHVLRVVDGEVVRQFAYALPQDQRGVQVEGEGLVVGDRLQGLFSVIFGLSPRRPRASPKTAEGIS